MRLRRLSIATGVAVLAAMALPAHASPIAAGTGKTHVIAACTKSVYKPAHYIFFCADGGAGLNHATYDTWHARTATGSGVYFFNDCTPSCAGGTIHHSRRRSSSTASSTRSGTGRFSPAAWSPPRTAITASSCRPGRSASTDVPRTLTTSYDVCGEGSQRLLHSDDSRRKITESCL